MELSENFLRLLVAAILILIITIPVLILYSLLYWLTELDDSYFKILKIVFTRKRHIISILSISFVIFLVIGFVSVFRFGNLQMPHAIRPDPVEEMLKGKIAYNIPDTMEVENHYKGTAAVTKALNDSILFLDLDSAHFHVEEIKVSSRIKITLIDPTGENFVIKSLNTEEQVVDTISNTVWRWNIQPIKHGENELMLSATIKVFDRLENGYKDISVLNKTIIVNASFTKVAAMYISNNQEWLIPLIVTTLIIPIFYWFRNFFKNRNGKNGAKPIGFQHSRKPSN